MFDAIVYGNRTGLGVNVHCAGKEPLKKKLRPVKPIRDRH